MLKILKRLVGLGKEPPKPPPKRKPVRKKQTVDRHHSGPTPLPEVVEGNEPTDWDLWQDSVDSQMQGLTRQQDSRFAETAPSELADIDPFASVRIKKPRR